MRLTVHQKSSMEVNKTCTKACYDLLLSIYEKYLPWVKQKLHKYNENCIRKIHNIHSCFCIHFLTEDANDVLLLIILQFLIFISHKKALKQSTEISEKLCYFFNFFSMKIKSCKLLCSPVKMETSQDLWSCKILLCFVETGMLHFVLWSPKWKIRMCSWSLIIIFFVLTFYSIVYLGILIYLAKMFAMMRCCVVHNIVLGS